MEKSKRSPFSDTNEIKILTKTNHRSSKHVKNMSIDSHTYENPVTNVILDRCQTAALLNDQGARLFEEGSFEMARDMFRGGIEAIREVEDAVEDAFVHDEDRKRIKPSCSRTNSSSSPSEEESQFSQGGSSATSLSSIPTNGKESSSEDDSSFSSSFSSSKKQLGRDILSLSFLTSPDFLADVSKCGIFISETVTAALIFNLALAHDVHARENASENSAQQALTLYSLARDSLSQGDEYVAVKDLRKIGCVEDLIECRQRVMHAVLRNSCGIYCEYGEIEEADRSYADLSAVNLVMRMQGFHYGGFAAEQQ